jgi:methionine-rich copper-binding protein CopC
MEVLMRKLLVAAAALLSLLGVLFSVQLVAAHSRPVRLTPAPGVVLETAPPQVSGQFTSDIRRDPNWSFIHVTGPDGSRVDAGDTQLSADRRGMTAQLRQGLGAGTYIVTWRTYDDADGAIFGDCYVFFVGQVAADQALKDNLRLDAGSRCERIDVEARAGTPVPGTTPTGSAEDEHDSGGVSDQSGGGGGGGVDAIFVLVGVGVGAVLGFLGSKVIRSA